MKKLLFMVSALAALASCSNEDVVEKTSTQGTAQKINISVANFVSDAATRTAVAVTEDGSTRTNDFTWTAGDQIGVYPTFSSVDNSQAQQQVAFTLNSGENSASATFQGTGWGLICDGYYTYYAYYPYNEANTANSVAVNYTDGLNQTANGNTEHLGVNDFLYAPAVTPADVEHAQLNFKHLSALLEVEITIPEGYRDRNFTKLQITAPDATTFVKSATYNPSTATESAVPTLSNKVYTDKITLNLNGGREADFETAGFAPDSDGKLHLFFLVAPTEIANKALTFKLWDSQNTAYIATKTPGKNIAAQAFKTYPFDVTVKPIEEAENLSVNAAGTQETANCYIVSENGKYKFLANVKGNGVEVTGGESATITTGKSAEVVWETVNTATAPTEGAIVKNVSYADNYITFEATGKPGNALIALKNASNEIVWSWHIWSTGADLDADAQEYPNNAGTMMDRNLGALSATPGNDFVLGFYYQWGRPCPITAVAKCGTLKPRMATTNSTLWVEEKTDATKGTLGYSAAHPTHLIYGSASNYYKGQTSGDVSCNWLWTADATSGYADAASMPALWGANKTMYDPCPIGWKVPSYSIWTTANIKDSDCTWEYNGMTLNPAEGAYYPAEGFIGNVGTSTSNEDGDVHMQTYGHYWLSDINGNKARDFYVVYSILRFDSYSRSFGFPVRPCKE